MKSERFVFDRLSKSSGMPSTVCEKNRRSTLDSVTAPLRVVDIRKTPARIEPERSPIRSRDQIPLGRPFSAKARTRPDQRHGGGGSLPEGSGLARGPWKWSLDRKCSRVSRGIRELGVRDRSVRVGFLSGGPGERRDSVGGQF